MNRGDQDYGNWIMVAQDIRLCSGQVTKWTYQGTTSLSFRAIIFRPVIYSDTTFTIVGINDIPAGPASAPVVYSVPEDDRIVVEEGDLIGWSFESGVLTMTPYRGTTKVRWVGGNPSAGLVTGQVVDINSGVQIREYSIRATVESYDKGTVYTY